MAYTTRHYAADKGRALRQALANCPRTIITDSNGDRSAPAYAAIDAAYQIHRYGKAAVKHWADPRLVRLALQLAAANAADL